VASALFWWVGRQQFPQGFDGDSNCLFCACWDSFRDHPCSPVAPYPSCMPASCPASLARPPAGLTPALAGSGLAWGAYFFAYNRAKERYQRRAAAAASSQSGRGGQGGAQPKLSPVMHLLSGTEAGVIVCLLTNPVWVVKTRLQLQRRTLEQAAAAASATASAATAAAAAAANSSGAAAEATAAAARAAQAAAEACAIEYRGSLHAFVQIARCEGIAGLYRGLLPSLLLVSCWQHAGRARGNSIPGGQGGHGTLGRSVGCVCLQAAPLTRPRLAAACRRCPMAPSSLLCTKN
jgi:hypothetical protein